MFEIHKIINPCRTNTCLFSTEQTYCILTPNVKNDFLLPKKYTAFKILKKRNIKSKQSEVGVNVNLNEEQSLYLTPTSDC